MKIPPKKLLKLQHTIQSFFMASGQNITEQIFEQNKSIPEGISTISETEEPSTSRIITVEGRRYQKSQEKNSHD